MSIRVPLRYQITNLRQLPRCRSNTSSELYILVSDFIQNSEINGMRISLKHRTYGDIFTCVVNASGSLTYSESTATELSPQQIISELSRYGFLIEYAPIVGENLVSDQVDYLITLDKLGFDKIRYLPVYSKSSKHVSDPVVPPEPQPTEDLYWNSVTDTDSDISESKVSADIPVYNADGGKSTYSYIVAFNISKNPSWLNNTHIATWDEYCTALANGSAINISAISQSKQYNWNWIENSVLSIKDVLQEIKEA